MDLSNGFMNDSASEFPCGHKGVTVTNSMPWISMYRLISCPLNGGPLSDTTLYGIPCVENILSSFGISAAADVECTISTSGYREYASIATSISSPVGSGPRKSMCTVCHGVGGIFDILRGTADSSPVAFIRAGARPEVGA